MSTHNIDGSTFTRKQWTTNSADPVVVVKWTPVTSDGQEKGSITECFGAYVGRGCFEHLSERALAAVHQLKERDWEASETAAQEQYDAETARLEDFE